MIKQIVQSIKDFIQKGFVSEGNNTLKQQFMDIEGSLKTILGEVPQSYRSIESKKLVIPRIQKATKEIIGELIILISDKTPNQKQIQDKLELLKNTIENITLNPIEHDKTLSLVNE